ncbi:hypothetical protein A3K80_00505 [Candidatus Bathyarchaeota archaeon RBG_13_38_9]|nr:MAG: hypothetical protein A3K80_00505 [Candidatus Bathyarchaeota archaeon RBG_13_38_9]
MNNIEKLVLVTAISLLAIGAFTGVGQYLATVDISAMPNWASPIVSALVQFFTWAPVTFVVIYFRNIMGYIRNWVLKEKNEKVDYDLKRYMGTAFYYLGVFNVALVALPAPYNALAAALTFVVDILLSEYQKIIPPE